VGGAESNLTVWEHGQLSPYPTLQDTALISKIKRHVQQFLRKFKKMSLLKNLSQK